MPTLYRRRPNGRWYIAYWQGGEQIRKSLRTMDPKLAKDLFEEFSARHRLGLLGLPGKKQIPTLQELFDEYLPFCKGHRSPRTYRDAKLHIRDFLGPFFGRLRAMDITAKHIEMFVGKMLNFIDPETGKPAPYHPRTINLRLETLRKVLRRAVENKDIPEMPCPVKLIKAPRALPRYATPKQIIAWLAALSPEHRRRAEFSLNTGITDIDVGRLLWSDYDVQASTLSYRRRKTSRDIVIPLNRRARRILAILEKTRRGPYVFGGIKSVRRAYRTASRESGINITPHMLRHTFATRLASLGIPESHIQDLLGHDDPESTRVYSYVMPEYLRASVATLDPPRRRTQTMHNKKGRSKRPA